MCKILDYFRKKRDEKEDAIGDGITYSFFIMLKELGITEVALNKGGTCTEFTENPDGTKSCDELMHDLIKRNSISKTRRKWFDKRVEKYMRHVNWVCSLNPIWYDSREIRKLVLKTHIVMDMLVSFSEEDMYELEKCIDKKQYLCIPWYE